MLQRCIKENKEATKESVYGKNILTIVPAAVSWSPWWIRQAMPPLWVRDLVPEWGDNLDSKEIKPNNPSGHPPWIFIGRTDAGAEAPVLWPSDAKSWLTEEIKSRYWERLRAGGEGDDRGWDSWMASLTWWTWVWVNSRSWWWTERPGVLWFMGSQRVRHRWATELNWTELNLIHIENVTSQMLYTHTHTHTQIPVGSVNQQWSSATWLFSPGVMRLIPIFLCLDHG